MLDYITHDKRCGYVMKDDLLTSMEVLLEASAFGIWLMNGDGTRFRKWTGTKESDTLREEWGTREGFEVEQDVGNISTDEGAVAHSEFKGVQMYRFRLNYPTQYEVRVLARTLVQLSTRGREHLSLLIRESLLCEIIEKQQYEHDRWLQGLRALTSSLDLDELLLNIMHNALTIIPSVEYGFFAMLDFESGKLVPRASVGIGERIYDFKVEKGEGITGKVFNEGKGRIYDAEDVVNAMDNVTEENMDSITNAFNADASLKAVMAVPVTMNQNKIGVMLVHQIHKEKQLDEEDLHQLQGFADQAAIAISNARLYYELRETNRYLVKRNEIHEVFTQLSIKDNNLETVVGTVGQMIGLPVVFVDAVKKEWYPRLVEMHDLSEMDLYREYADTMAPKTVKVSDSREYYLYPIVNGSVLLGCFVVELQRPLQQLDHVVLEQGGVVVVLEMVNTYSLTEMYYRRNHEFFNELVMYKEPKKIEASLASFGLPKNVPLFVCVLQLFIEDQNLKKQEHYLRQLIAGIERELGKTDIMLFGAHDKITIVAAAIGTESQNLIIEKLEMAVKRWTTTDTPLLFGGIGGVHKGLENVAKSSEEANRSLSFLLGRGKTGITRYDDIGINRLFLNQKPEEIEDYINEVLSPLRSPRSNSGELEHTLKTYMTANRSTSVTAEQLHIHPNTLYHRLRKVEEILQIDLNEPDDWFKVYLACHLSETY